MKLKINILSLFLIVSVQAQEFEIKQSFELPFVPTSSSIDRQGYLYFASQDGVIEKYDQQGKLQYHFSPQTRASPSLIEAWQGLRIFVYYQSFQEYLFLNRFLTESERYNLESLNLSDFNGLATLSADNNLWLINSNTLLLSKVDINNGEVLFENYLTLTLGTDQFEPKFIREYQNLLFISDVNRGIFIFDNLGNFVEKLDLENNGFFSFTKNQLITVTSKGIQLTDIYTKTKREISTANLSYQIVFMENNRFIALSGKRVDILSIN